MTVVEMRMLNLCLDVAIAEAVREFSRRREQRITSDGVEQIGFLAHELRNLLGTATIAVDAITSGHVGASGSTATLLTRAIEGMRDLVSRTLAEVRLESEHTRRDRVMVATIVEEVEVALVMQARAAHVFLAVEPTAALDMTFVGDAQIASAILHNLVQNACKFTRANGRITITVRSTKEHLAIDVAGECGGLPPGKAADLFRPFEQRGRDRTGLGLGLAISRKGALALGGTLDVADVPGHGCVFTLTLPRA